MFICEKCSYGKVDPIWYIIGAISYGKCEVCGNPRPCFDDHTNSYKTEKKETAK